tara:strand:- start:20532 stop:21311 length:780 start_codon:yes stop_codon:yes gene_type:complete
MRILLTGNTGYLGSYLSSELSRRNFQVFCASRDTLPDIVFDYVIFCNADTTNLFDDKSQRSVYNLLRQCKQKYHQAKFIFFSSYYVYNGLSKFGLSEKEGETSSFFAYQKYKLFSERYLSEDDLVLRLGKLFANPYRVNKNFIGSLRRNKKITVDDCLFNPVSVYQVLDAIDYELSSGRLKGIYNLGNEDHSSHHKFSEDFKEVFDLDLEIELSSRKNTLPNYGMFLMDLNKIRSKIKLRNYVDDIKLFKQYVNIRRND